MSADTPERKEALHRYNIVLLAERFGWTAEYIDSLDLDLYQDIIAITRILDFKRRKAQGS